VSECRARDDGLQELQKSFKNSLPKIRKLGAVPRRVQPADVRGVEERRLASALGYVDSAHSQYLTAGSTSVPRTRFVETHRIDAAGHASTVLQEVRMPSAKRKSPPN
jgi:hypothetical protein